MSRLDWSSEHEKMFEREQSFIILSKYLEAYRFTVAIATRNSLFDAFEHVLEKGKLEFLHLNSAIERETVSEN